MRSLKVIKVFKLQFLNKFANHDPLIVEFDSYKGLKVRITQPPLHLFEALFFSAHVFSNFFGSMTLKFLGHPF